MNSASPTGTGFRLIFRRPAIPLAEIAWRWSFGVASSFLFFVFIFEYLDTLPVNAVSRFLLGTGQPILIARALQRIFEGSAFRFTRAGVLLAIALTLLWIVSASLGRLVTVNSIARELGFSQKPDGRPFSSLLLINFLRAAVSIAAVTGTFGSVMISSSFWASTHVSSADALGLFGFLCFLIWLACSVLNWILSLAGAFAVVERQGALPAISSAVALVVRKTGGVISVGVLFEVLHFAAFVIATQAAGLVFGLVGAISMRPAILLELIIAAIYFSIADFLYTARLAAYISALRKDELLITPEIEPPLTARSASIDQSELILSDLPAPAI